MQDVKKPPEVVQLAGGDTSEGSSHPRVCGELFDVSIHAQGANDEAESLPGRVDRYGIARTRARQMLEHLHGLSDCPLPAASLAQLAECGEWLRFHHYFTVGRVRLAGASFCRMHLLCPLCAVRRGAKALKAYLDRFEAVSAASPLLRPFLVTFTVRNGPDLRERFEHLQKSLQRLHDRRRDFFKKGRGRTEARHALGAVWSYEVTNKGKGWHPHVHAVWLCEVEPDQAALRREWHDITGDSFMVDVRPISPADPVSGFIEVFKYAVKFSGLDLVDNVAAWAVLRGRRLLGSFGVFRCVEIPEGLLDEPLEGLPFIELFYRFVPGVGYDLQLTRVCHE